MKNLFTLLILLISLTLFAQEKPPYEVEKFTADFYLNKDGSVDVTENYEVQFNEASHGIIRAFIIRKTVYEEKLKPQKRTLYFSNIDVKGAKFSRTSDYKLMDSSILEIKIGDKNKLVQGKVNYQISYTVRNAMLIMEDETAFYWNVKSEEWDCPFNSVEYRVHVPEGQAVTENDSYTYSGGYGNTENSEDFEYSYNENIYTAKSISGKSFNQFNLITTLVFVPNQYIPGNDLTTVYFRRYQWIGILFIAGFLFWLFVYKKFKDKNKVFATTSYYPPVAVDPALAGYLINSQEDNSDLIALIPQWAIEGRIKIEEKLINGKKDLELTYLGELEKNPPGYKKVFMAGLFPNIKKEPTITLSALRKRIYPTMNLAKSQLKIIGGEFFDSKYEEKTELIIVGVVIAGLISPAAFFYFYGWTATFICALFYLILIFLTANIRVRNAEGNKVYSELIGFKKFIKLADIERIKELLKNDPLYFEKTMPYALAFGMLNKWSAKFEPIIESSPDWYKTTGSRDFRNFNRSFSQSMILANKMLKGVPPSTPVSTFKSQTRTVSRNISSPSRSSYRSSSSGRRSGGGFSGGGFGGGGGRRW